MPPQSIYRVHTQRNWAMKAAAIQIPMKLLHGVTILTENKTSNIQAPKMAFTEASNRISSLNRQWAAINIYIDVMFVDRHQVCY